MSWVMKLGSDAEAHWWETIDHGLKTFEKALNKGPEKYTDVISISYTKEKTKVGFRMWRVV